MQDAMRARGPKGAKAEGGAEGGGPESSFLMNMESAMSRKSQVSRADLRKKRAQPTIMQPEEGGLSARKGGGESEY